MIWNAAIRLQSTKLLAAEISIVTGVQPTQQFDIGQPVSSRNPAGPKHLTTTWICDLLEQAGEDLAIDISKLTSILDAIDVVPRDQLFRDLIVGASGKPTGDLLEISNEVMRILGTYGANLIIDLWDSTGR